MSIRGRYFVVYDEPAVSKEVNDFLAGCDLGIVGAFVRKTAVARVTFENQESKDRFPDTYRKAVKAVGGILIYIKEIEDEVEG